MGLSSASLFGSLIIGSVGFGIFLYGKKQVRLPQLVVGLVLMIYPYFIPGALALWGVGALCIAALFVALRMGL